MTPSPAPVPAVPYYESADRPIDYKYYFHLLKRNLNLIVILLVIGVTLSSIYISRLPDEYEATTQIILERPRGGGQVTQLMMAPDIWMEDYYNTQKEIMVGPTVLREVVGELKLVEYFGAANEEDAVRQLRGLLRIQRIRDSRLFNMTATSSDPQFSMALANAVSRAYIRKNFEDLLYFSKEILSWVPEEGAEVITVEDPFGRIKQLTRQELVDSLPSIRTDPTVRELESKKSSLEAELTTLLKQYREKHPFVVKAQANLRFLNDSITAEKQRVIESLKQQAAGQYQVSTARIVEEAELPKSPAGPARMRLVLSWVGGEFFVIFLFIFLWDYFDDTVHSPDDLARKGIHLAFLGPVPLVKEFDVPEEERFLVSHYHRRSEVAESFRYLRVAINFSASPETLKNLVFTSALPNEGKSFIAHNTAVSLAQDGNRTLLIDADLRKPVAQRVYRMENVSGLSNFLTSSIEFESIVRETFIENLSVILSGPVSPNPAEILASGRMAELLEKVRGQFDRIIIDAPPLTGIGDALILGSLTTHVVLVIRCGKTPTEVVLRAKDVLEKSGVRIIGTILNQVDLAKERYSGYYKYYYQSYSRYYSSSSRAEGEEEEET